MNIIIKWPQPSGAGLRPLHLVAPLLQLARGLFCLCICIYMCVYIYIYICIYAYMHICT